MFSLEYIDGILMWQYLNTGKPDASIVDPETLEPNLAGEAYLRYSMFLTYYDLTLSII